MITTDWAKTVRNLAFDLLRARREREEIEEETFCEEPYITPPLPAVNPSPAEPICTFSLETFDCLCPDCRRKKAKIIAEYIYQLEHEGECEGWKEPLRRRFVTK